MLPHPHDGKSDDRIQGNASEPENLNFALSKDNPFFLSSYLDLSKNLEFSLNGNASSIQ